MRLRLSRKNWAERFKDFKLTSRMVFFIRQSLFTAMYFASRLGSSFNSFRKRNPTVKFRFSSGSSGGFSGGGEVAGRWKLVNQKSVHQSLFSYPFAVVSVFANITIINFCLLWIQKPNPKSNRLNCPPSSTNSRHARLKESANMPRCLRLCNKLI